VKDSHRIDSRWARCGNRHAISATAPSSATTAVNVARSGVALASSLSSADNISNRFNDKLRLIALDKVSALFGRAKLPMRRALGEILLKPSPSAIPRRELLFGHSVR
jgi:hypothetical protein